MKRLHNFEIQRQELLKELVHTERTHLKKLQIMKHVRMIALYSVSVFATTPPPLSLSLSVDLQKPSLPTKYLIITTSRTALP